MNPALIAQIVLAVLMSAAAQVMLKLGMSSPAVQAGLHAGRLVASVRPILLSPWLIGGIGLYGLSVGVWLLVLSRTDVSYAYPFVALGMVVTTLSGHFLLGEPLPPLRLIGLAVILVGIATVASSIPRSL